ncbi:MAG: hypothetical protein KF752_06810 [Pirellulaceae bacterium]|nr:hypothetical protein [Pirellulaceae bacterium]
MKKPFSKLSPRTWAVLIASVGTFLSVPFLKSHTPSKRSAPNTVSPPVATTAVSDSGSSQGSPGSEQGVREDRSSSPSDTDVRQATSSKAADTWAGMERLSDAVSAPAELPSWARKPSPLDALMSGQISSAPAKAIERKVIVSPPARDSTAHQLPNPADQVESKTKPSQASGFGRYTPFADDRLEHSSQGALALSAVAWPDQDWLPDVQTLASEVTRKNMDVPTAARTHGSESADFASNGRPMIILGGAVGAGSQRLIQATLNSRVNGPTSSSDIQQPARRIGAALRSQLPPSPELVIEQPVGRAAVGNLP